MYALCCRGDQDLMIPVAQTRKLATALAKHLKLTTLLRNGPWYNGVQVYQGHLTQQT